MGKRGGLFDFNGDGKESFFERALAFKMFEEFMKEDDDYDDEYDVDYDYDEDDYDDDLDEDLWQQTLGIGGGVQLESAGMKVSAGSFFNVTQHFSIFGEKECVNVRIEGVFTSGIYYNKDKI